MAGVEFGRDEQTETFFTPQQRMTAQVQRLFDRYPHGKVTDMMMSAGGMSLSRTRGRDEMLSQIYLREEMPGDIAYQHELRILYKSDNPQVSLTERKKNHTVILLEYSEQKGENKFFLPDEIEIKIPGDMVSKNIYSFSKGGLVAESGVDLTVSEEEGRLVVRDDPYVSGLIFPRHIDLDEELEKFEERLKRK
jgi:hypothetical protein